MKNITFFLIFIGSVSLCHLEPGQAGEVVATRKDSQVGVTSAISKSPDGLGVTLQLPGCLDEKAKSQNYFRTKFDPLSKKPVGFKCKFIGGAIWERVDKPGFGEAWKDLETGITWSENVGGATNSGQSNGDLVIDSDAVSACRAIGGELPSASDFVKGQDNYSTWILPQFAKSQTPKYRDESFTYWTKNVRPHDKIAIVFDAVNGYSAIDRSKQALVRCISR